MTVPVFTQNVIAVIWDFDKTLIPGNMQEPLFERDNIDGDAFWAEVNSLPNLYREMGCELVSADTIYLNHILTYVRAQRFKDLNNQVLYELGKKLTFYPGMPKFMAELKDLVAGEQKFRHHEITLEHYIVSTGLLRMVRGSAVAKHVDGIWACEFLETVAPPGYLKNPPSMPEKPVLEAVAYSIDNTTKTRAIFEINKGVNKFPNEIQVNSTIASEDRRVPFENMIYIADGPSDVPVFSILNQYGGKTFAVYNPDPNEFKEFRQVASLAAQGRVQATGPANYKSGSHTANWLRLWVTEIAEEIVRRRERRLHESVGAAPRHIPAAPSPAPPNAEAPRDRIEHSPAARAAAEPRAPRRQTARAATSTQAGNAARSDTAGGRKTSKRTGGASRPRATATGSPKPRPRSADGEAARRRKQSS